MHSPFVSFLNCKKLCEQNFDLLWVQAGSHWKFCSELSELIKSHNAYFSYIFLWELDDILKFAWYHLAFQRCLKVLKKN